MSKICNLKNALVIFTRNPELGKCKTRLAKVVGDKSALEIYKYLLQHTANVSKEVDALKEAFTGATKQIQNLTGSLQSATVAAATIKIPENFQVNVDELNNRLASASVSVSQVQDVYNNIEKSLDGQPESHRDVVSASDKLVIQLEEMNSLVKQLNEKYAAISKAMGN